jgi:hypothetical protein
MMWSEGVGPGRPAARAPPRPASESRTARTLFVLFLLLLFWLPSSKFWFHALFALSAFWEELQ